MEESETDKNERLAKWENYLKESEEGKQVNLTEQKTASSSNSNEEQEATAN